MAQRRATKRNGRETSSRREVKEKRTQADQATAEQMFRSLLDDPRQPDQASPARGFVYFAVIVVGALLLNLLVLIAISGGG